MAQSRNEDRAFSLFFVRFVCGLGSQFCRHGFAFSLARGSCSRLGLSFPWLDARTKGLLPPKIEGRRWKAI